MPSTTRRASRSNAKCSNEPHRPPHHLSHTLDRGAVDNLAIFRIALMLGEGESRDRPDSFAGRRRLHQTRGRRFQGGPFSNDRGLTRATSRTAPRRYRPIIFRRLADEAGSRRWCDFFGCGADVPADAKTHPQPNCRVPLTHPDGRFGIALW